MSKKTYLQPGQRIQKIIGSLEAQVDHCSVIQRQESESVEEWALKFDELGTVKNMTVIPLDDAGEQVGLRWNQEEHGMTLQLSVVGRVDTSAPTLKLPLAAGEVRTGFPSPADDYLEAELDLVQHLVQHPSATYYLRAKGTSMTGAGIFDGDLLIVDRSLTPKSGHIVIMSVDGELTCKKLGTIGNRPYLIAANPEFRPMPLEGRECQVWGVVTHNIHSLAPGFAV